MNMLIPSRPTVCDGGWSNILVNFTYTIYFFFFKIHQHFFRRHGIVCDFSPRFDMFSPLFTASYVLFHYT